jgi:hypothetical protein
VACLGNQLLSTGLGQLVETCLAIVVRRTPLSANPSTRFKALKRRVQRAVINKKRVFGLLLYRAGDALAVLLSKQDGAEDQQIKGAL